MTAARGNNAEGAAEARKIVMNAIVHRGGTVGEVRDGRRWELHGHGTQGAFRVRVVSRRRGDWQSSIREADGPGDVGRHWVFVEYGSAAPRFWIMPRLRSSLGSVTATATTSPATPAIGCRTMRRCTARSPQVMSRPVPIDGTCWV